MGVGVVGDKTKRQESQDGKDLKICTLIYHMSENTYRINCIVRKTLSRHNNEHSRQVIHQNSDKPLTGLYRTG